jgi:hypothetical protein
MRVDQSEGSVQDRFAGLDGEVVELALLLPRGPAVRLERLAAARGLTLAQLVRLVLREYLATQPAAGTEKARSSRADSPAPR